MNTVKNQIKTTKKNNAKKVKTFKPIAKKETPKKETPKKKVDIYATNYGKQVLTINADYKTANKTVGGCRSTLLNLHNEKLLTLQPYQIAILKASKKSQPVYEVLKKQCYHHPKTGNTSPFYLLQSLYNADKREVIERVIKNA